MSTAAAHAHSDRTRTWWSLALFPLAFVAAFVVGEGLVTLYGYEVHAEASPPWWVVLAAGIPALLVFCVPAVVTVYVGRRALKAGDLGARVPMGIAIVLTALFVAQNLLAFLLG